MTHTHKLFDNDSPFTIDVESRNIRAEPEEVVVVQGDHRSEIITFSMPRFIGNHDMTLCNFVEIFYENIDNKTKEINKGGVQIEDLRVDEADENKVVFSWAIHGNATIYAGTLNFSISFSCSDEGIAFKWNTKICEIIKVEKSNGFEVIDYDGEAIHFTNEFLTDITTGDFEETTSLDHWRMNAVKEGLRESKEVLTNKGVEIVDPFGINDIPPAIEVLESKETVESYKTQVEQAQAELTEATERAEIAEANLSTYQDYSKAVTERSATELVIPAGITNIGSYAFYNNSYLTSVTIGNNVSGIKSQAFLGCTKLASVTILKNVKNLWDSVFSGCTALKTLMLPNSITSIANYCFNGCTNLTNITLEQGFNCNLDVASSKKYSAETLVAMLEALADLTGQTSKTLTIGSTNINKLSAEQKLIATSKNWQLG